MDKVAICHPSTQCYAISGTLFPISGGRPALPVPSPAAISLSPLTSLVTTAGPLVGPARPTCNYRFPFPNRHGGPHHHFFGGDRVVSHGFVVGVARAVVAAVAALRLSAATFHALASGTCGLSRVIVSNAAPATALPAACRLKSGVWSTKACGSASSRPETAVGRGRQKRSWANFTKTWSAFVLARPPLVRRRKPNRVRAASSVVVWVR
jgi:hypothetical protein